MLFQFGIISPCFYTEFFIKTLFNRIAKAKNTKDQELPRNHAQTSVQEFLSLKKFFCHML